MAYPGGKREEMSSLSCNLLPRVKEKMSRFVHRFHPYETDKASKEKPHAQGRERSDHGHPGRQCKFICILVLVLQNPLNAHG